MQQLLLEMNSTCISNGLYTKSFNMLRWMILDPKLKMNGKNSATIIEAIIESNFDHDVYVHW